MVSALIGILIFLALVLGTALLNRRGWRRLGSYAPVRGGRRVSVVVPARNEARSIEACVRSILAQDYADLEVLALDDGSTDGTGAILARLAAEPAGGRLRVLAGQPLPAGWMGKMWACHQLAEAATGECLLFTDADTKHAPGALSRAMGALAEERVGLVTALPRQAMASWGERLLVSVIPWSLFSFLPVPLAHRLQWPALTAAVGQFMLFQRAAYDRAGGYAAVRAHGNDDLTLARRVVAAGAGWRLLRGEGHVRTRMYTRGRTAWRGFARNLYAAFDYQTLPFLFVWLWVGHAYLAPWVALAVGPGAPERILALAAIALGALTWWLALSALGLPRRLVLIYPASVAAAVAVALASVWLTRTGRNTWKGRGLAVARRRPVAVNDQPRARL